VHNWISNKDFVNYAYLGIFGYVFPKDWAKCKWNDSNAFVVKFNLALHWTQTLDGNNASSVIWMSNII